MNCAPHISQNWWFARKLIAIFTILTTKIVTILHSIIQLTCLLTLCFQYGFLLLFCSSFPSHSPFSTFMFFFFTHLISNKVVVRKLHTNIIIVTAFSDSIEILFAAIARHDPEITGLMQSYALGDFIEANCTSDQSNPPSDLQWYFDERRVRITF